MRMAFIKKKSNLGKIILILFAVAAISCLIVGGFYFANRYVNEIKQDYELQLASSKRHVYIPKAKITYGTQLKKELFSDALITASIDKEYFLTQEDFGKFARNDIIPGIPAMKYMVSEGKIEDDIREEEFNMFMLQSKLEKNKFIDIRIMFPNGEDFIVLSKKKIQDINIAQNTIWCWLDEREILTVSGAIVDAYINKGSKLYVVTYIEPSTQKESIPTYPANIDVMRLMNSDPNIVNKAKLYLAEQVRTALDSRLKAMLPETMAKVQSEVAKEYSGITGTIQKDVQNNNNSSSKNTTPNTGQSLPQPPKEASPSTAPTNVDKKEGAKSGFFN